MSLLRALQRDGRDHRWDDVLAAVVVATAVVVLATGADVDALAPHSHPDLLAWVATIGIGLTVLGRRRWPLRSLAVACALLLVLGASDSGDTVRFLAWIILVYSAGAHLPRRPALGAAAMVLVLAIVSHFLHAADPSTGLVGAGAAFGLGRLIRRRRTDQEAQATAARLHATAVVETAELAAAADRQRMAQELHDVVAHSLSVIAVQAGIGAHLIVRQPAEAARALDAIRVASDAAGGELARLVELLRDGDAGRSEPAPSLTDLPALCEQVAAAGVPTELVVEGDVGTVPSGVSLAAYRIVQEALTNVVRHAGPATAAVTVRVFADHVQLGIDDDGAGAPTPTEPDRTGPGHGVIGMRERAQLYGGGATIGPRTGGGFRVDATLRYFVDAVDVDDSGVADSADLDADPQSARRGAGRSLLSWDVALAVVFAIVGVVELASTTPDVFTPSDTWAWLLKIGCCLTLVGRRRWPTASLAVAAAAALALTVGDYETGVVALVFVVGLYAVGSYATTARLVAALGGVVVTMGVVAWSDPPDLSTAGAVWTGAIAAAAGVAGFAVRRDRERRDATTARHQVAASAQSRRTRLAVATERLRIAEELNVAITRSVRSISVRAGSGSQLVESDPAGALELLETISATSRDALGDLRRLLKRMRTADAPTAYAPVAPDPDPDAITTCGSR